MNTSQKILFAGAATLVGAILYKSLMRKKVLPQESEGRRHKNRHLSPVFSKLKHTETIAAE